MDNASRDMSPDVLERTAQEPPSPTVESLQEIIRRMSLEACDRDHLIGHLQIDIRGITARAEEAERFLRLRDRQMETTRKFWIRDAEEALAGDPRALRNRVEMAKMPPMEFVLSGSPSPSKQEG